MREDRNAELAKAWNTKTFKARIPAVIEFLKQKAEG
jgi:hypothetical protein